MVLGRSSRQVKRSSNASEPSVRWRWSTANAVCAESCSDVEMPFGRRVVEGRASAGWCGDVRNARRDRRGTDRIWSR